MTETQLQDEYRCVLPSRRHPLHFDEPGRVSFEITLRPPKVDLNQPVLVRFAITTRDEGCEFVENEAKWYDLDLHYLEDLGLMLTCAHELRGAFTEVDTSEIIEMYGGGVEPRRMYHSLVESVYGHDFRLWWREWRGQSGAERVDRELLLFGWTLWLDLIDGKDLCTERRSVLDADVSTTGYILVDPDDCVVFGKELANTAAQVGGALFDEANRRNFWDDRGAD